MRVCWPLGACLRKLASNHHERLRLRAFGRERYGKGETSNYDEPFVRNTA